MPGFAHGAYEWLWGRISGALMIPTGLWWLWFLRDLHQMSAQQICDALSNVWNTIPFFITLVFFVIHAYLGMREIIVDYLPNPRLSYWAHGSLILGLFGGGIVLGVCVLRGII